SGRRSTTPPRTLGRCAPSAPRTSSEHLIHEGPAVRGQTGRVSVLPVADVFIERCHHSSAVIGGLEAIKSATPRSEEAHPARFLPVEAEGRLGQLRVGDRLVRLNHKSVYRPLQ